MFLLMWMSFFLVPANEFIRQSKEKQKSKINLLRCFSEKEKNLMILQFLDNALME